MLLGREEIWPWKVTAGLAPGREKTQQKCKQGALRAADTEPGQAANVASGSDSTNTPGWPARVSRGVEHVRQSLAFQKLGYCGP